MRIEVPSYNTYVEFPDDMPQDQIPAILDKEFPPLSKSTFRKQLTPASKEQVPLKPEVDPVINPEMGQKESRPAWADVADFLTGHFAQTKDVPEVQTVDGKLKVTVPETAEMPVLQDPVTALGFGIAGGALKTGSALAKLGKGAETTAGWMTGGASDIAKVGAEGATSIARNISEELPTLSKVAVKIKDPVQQKDFIEHIAKTSHETGRPLDEVVMDSVPKVEVKSPPIMGTIVYRGGESPLDLTRGSNRGISVTTKKDIADNFMPPEGGVISEAILPNHAKILREDEIPTALQDSYMSEAKKLAKFPLTGSDAAFERLQKSVIDKQQTIIEHARAKGYDAVEFPFEDEIRIVRPNILKPLLTPESLEPLVKGGSTKELPKYAEGSNINLERLDTTQDVKQFINNEASQAGIERRKISWAETEKLGEELGWDTADFLKWAKKEGGLTSPKAAAMRQVHLNAQEDVVNALKNLPADVSLRTPEMRINAADKINNLYEIMKSYDVKAGEAGRTLNYFRKEITSNPEYAQNARRKKVLETIMDKMGVNKMTDEMIDDLAKVDFKDIASVREVLQKYHKSSLTDKLYFAWMNGLLSAFPTHEANIIGNLGAVALKVPEHAASNLIRLRNPLGEATAESIGLYNGIADGARAALETWKTGIPSYASSYVELKNFNPIPGKLGKVIGIPTRALTAADEFFKAILYRSELSRQAFIKTKGISNAAERKAAMDTLMNNPTHEGFKEIHELAQNEALYRTYQKPLGDFGNAVLRLRDTHAAAKFLAPFIKTPINIAKFTLERTPFGLVDLARDMKAGRVSDDKVFDQLGKSMIGNFISAAVVMAALDGKITGGGPVDKKERELWSLTHQPYSIRIGNSWYSYNRFEPVGSVMGIAADYIDVAKSDEDINAKAGLMAKAVTRNITSKTFVTGISKALQAFSGDESAAKAWVDQMAGSVVPAAVGRLAAAKDPYVREVQNPIEAVQARIPGLSESLPYKPKATLATQGGVPITVPNIRSGGPAAQIFSPVQVMDIPENADMYEALLEKHRVEKKMAKSLIEAKKEPLRDIRRTNK